MSRQGIVLCSGHSITIRAEQTGQDTDMGKKRQVKKVYKAIHGRQAKTRMNLPATDKQIALLETLGVSRRKSSRMTSGQASLEITKRQS